MFAIMKNAGSFSNPLLVNWPGNGGLMYSRLENVFRHPEMKLMTFGSIPEAKTFIGDHPEVCDERCVVCEAKFGPENRSVIFEPIKR